MKPVRRLSRCVLPVALTLSLLAACSTGIQVFEYSTGNEAGLPAMAQYCWAGDGAETLMKTIETAGGHHPFFDSTVRAAINDTLTAKGYRQSSCREADFLIDYRMGLHEDIAANDASTEDTLHDYGLKWRIGNDASLEYQGLSRPDEVIITVRHGTLHIAAFKPDGQLLWHGSAEKTLNERDTDDQRLATVHEAAQKVLDRFPAR